MITRTATIASSVGLHARPANLFVQEVARLGVPVMIHTVGKRPVDARSMLGVMTLGAKHGDVVTLTSEDPEAAEALDSLAAFLEIDHDAA